jgi:hypothetical protein
MINRSILLLNKSDQKSTSFFLLILNINQKMKFDPTMKLGLVLGGVVLLFVLMNNYSATKGSVGEGMEQLANSLGVSGPLAEQGPMGKGKHSGGGNAQPVESLQARHPSSQSTYSASTLSAAELLPKGEIGASWAAVNPASAGDLAGQNFLQAGYHTNTAVAGVAQTNRNASWDIRSEAPNPQGSVGPFLNTTIEPNPFKRSLEA